LAVRVGVARLATPSRPLHLSHVCDVGLRPSLGQDKCCLQVIWGRGKQKYFFEEGLTNQNALLFFRR
jgi:hypothetical protein